MEKENITLKNWFLRMLVEQDMWKEGDWNEYCYNPSLTLTVERLANGWQLTSTYCKGGIDPIVKRSTHADLCVLVRRCLIAHNVKY